MDARNAGDFAREWGEAFNAHDLERVLSHYSDDIDLISPIAVERFGRHDGAVRGKSELRAYLEPVLRAGSRLRFDIRRVYSGVASLVIEYDRHDGRRGAEFMQIDENGKITRVVAHYSDIRGTQS